MKLHPIPSCHSLNQENLALVPQQYTLQLEETTLLRKKAADILDCDVELTLVDRQTGKRYKCE